MRYEALPLETRDGRKIAVGFASNAYQAGDKNVIQCNIRDITNRKLAQSEFLWQLRNFVPATMNRGASSAWPSAANSA